MNCEDIIREGASLLYWTMLAACTVGPGTVVSCARAGAEYELNLIWALIFASILAYTLQEGSARLTIVSSKSLGECLQLKYPHGRKMWNIGIFGWIVVIAVFVGNTLLECNCFAGGMAAIYALPPASDTDALRISFCIAYGIIVMAILFAGKGDGLGIALGIVMLSMVILFLVVVIKLGVNMEQFAKGLVPISMPSGSSNIVLSLIGTTSLGFNLFLGGEMAKGKTLRGAQRGIAFSTFMTLMVSVLILIVGSGTHKGSKGVFTIDHLASLVATLTGKVGIWVFGIGFIAAAVSSMLTVPLGAAITADSILTINERKYSSVKLEAVKGKGTESEEKLTPPSGTLSMDSIKPHQLPAVDESSPSSETASVEIPDDVVTSSDILARPFPKKYFNGLLFVMVLISLCVIAADAPTVEVILIAQVFNGCLLPFFSICLLMCINDRVYMKESPQKGWANCCLITGVFFTIVLTSNTIIENAFGWLVNHHHATHSTFEMYKFIFSVVCGVFVMAMLLFLTQLGEDVKRSFGVFFRRTVPHPEFIGANIFTTGPPTAT